MLRVRVGASPVLFFLRAFFAAAFSSFDLRLPSITQRSIAPPVTADRRTC